MEIQRIEEKLKIKFKDKRLLGLALIHRSYLNETSERGLESNERLEFLGDAVLEFVISNWLYQLFPAFPEGQLTNLRSNLVQKATLYRLAKNFGLGENLKMSRGEADSGGQQNTSLLANCFEAVIGAVYLDQGITVAEDFLKQAFNPIIKEFSEKKEFKDNKTLLQEKVQAKTKEPPTYKTLKAEGPDHNKIFTVGVFSLGRMIGEGTGKSKQEAEEQAATNALKK